MSTNDAGTGQGKVQELVNYFKKKFKLGKKKKEDELFEDEEEEQLSKEEKEELNPDKAIGGASMLDGEHGKIFGVSRPVVVGIGLFIFLVFSFALIFATDDSSDQQAKKPAQVAESNINKSKDDKNNELPSDYETLAKQDPTHRSAQNKNQPVPGQNGAPATVQAQRTTSAVPAQQAVAAPVQTSTVPRVTAVAAPPSYSQPYQVPASVSAPAAPAASSSDDNDSSSSSSSSSGEKSLKDRFASAIAFGLGGGSMDSGSASNSGGGDAASGSAATTATSASSETTYAAASVNTLTAGTTIPAMLLTGIDTNVQGQVKAQVMADVYDYSGNNLLIPAGSQVLGSYSSGSGSTGNSRVQVNFNTLIMPDGGTWNIGNSLTAIDGNGYSGIQGRLHRHTGANFAKGLMNSALMALSTIGVDNVTMDLSAYQYLTNASNNVNITVDPGYQFSLYVTNNINF